jgi:hypothetical protein
VRPGLPGGRHRPELARLTDEPRLGR